MQQSIGRKQLGNLGNLFCSGGVISHVADIWEYASLHQRPSCFTVAGGRPALAAVVAAPILKLWVLSFPGS